MLRIAAEHQLTPEERVLAACLAEDPEQFFEPDGRRDSQDEADRIADAKHVCASCDVRTRCLEVALANNERHGIWGGLDAEERASIRRKAQRARAAKKAAPAATPEPSAPASTEEVPVPSKPPAEQSRAIVSLYTGAEKLSQASIAQRLNVSVAVVRAALQEAGVTIRRGGGYTAEQRAKRPNVDRDQRVRQVVVMYTGPEQLSQAQIAERLGMSTNTVAKMLREADVEIRPVGHHCPKAPSKIADEVAARPDSEPAPAPRPSVRPASSGHGFVWSCPGHKPVAADLARTYEEAWAGLDKHFRTEHPQDQEAAA